MPNTEKSFKFILTFLTAVGTIIYTSYYYFQTSTLDNTLFIPVMAFVTILLIFSFYLITYVLILGFAPLLEDYPFVNDILNNIKKRISAKGFVSAMISIWFASSVYALLLLLSVVQGREIGSYFNLDSLHLFLIIIVIFGIIFGILSCSIKQLIRKKKLVLIIFIPILIFYFLLSKGWPLDFSLFLTILTIILFVSVFLVSLVKRESIEKIVDRNTVSARDGNNSISPNLYNVKPNIRIEDNGSFIISLFISLSLFIWIWGFSYIPISILFQGHAEIHMDNNTYYKDGTPIYVSIDITGRKPISTIYLNKSSGNRLIQIDTLIFERNHKKENIFGENKTLFGNTFSSGRYDIFINTTNPNMSEGYYELVFTRQDMIESRNYSLISESVTEGYKYIGKGFYLLDNITK